jgi:D-aminoacyl-tRNA deacylase
MINPAKSFKMNTLFIATQTDAASMNIAEALISKFGWKPLIETSKNEITHEIFSIESTTSLKLYLWIINTPMLHLNYANKLFVDNFLNDPSYNPDEIIFLSRHSAASGTKSLTVHPIGIPWLDDCTISGGLPRRCSPPNPRIASLYREILMEVKSKELDNTFQVTLEATHHGPYVEVPACFVEIGSSESEWEDGDAGIAWANCLSKHFDFNLKKNIDNAVLIKAFDLENTEIVDIIDKKNIDIINKNDVKKKNGDFLSKNKSIENKDENSTLFIDEKTVLNFVNEIENLFVEEKNNIQLQNNVNVSVVSCSNNEFCNNKNIAVDNSNDNSSNSNNNFYYDPSYVVVTIGGGHYVPKANDLVFFIIIFFLNFFIMFYLYWILSNYFNIQSFFFLNNFQSNLGKA